MSEPLEIKVLIVYERTGMGHEVMANIIAAHLSHHPHIKIIQKAGSDLIKDPLVDLIVNAWNFLIRHDLIFLADVLVNYLLRLILLLLATITTTSQLHNKLDEISPDIIICTADGFAKSLGDWATEQKIPIFIIVMDLAVFYDVVHPKATHLCYFPETLNALQSFSLEQTYWSKCLTRASNLGDKTEFVFGYLRDFIFSFPQNNIDNIYRNINNKYETKNNIRCEVIGPICEEKHYISHNWKKLREQLKIPIDRPCILMVSGSIGGAGIKKYITVLQEFFQKNLTIIAVCGRDEKLQAKVSKMANQNSHIQVHSLGFVDNLHQWMSAVDVILARPSAGVFRESLLARTPLLLPRRATANDLGTVIFVEKYQIGESFTDNHELTQKLNYILEVGKDRYRTKIDTLLSPYPSTFDECGEMIRDLILKKV